MKHTVAAKEGRGTLQQGAWNAVNTCMSIDLGEKVAVVTDRRTEAVGRAIYKEAVRTTGNPDCVKLFVLEDYGQRPFSRNIPMQLEDGLKELRPDAAFYAAEGQAGELPRFRGPLIQLMVGPINARLANMVGVTPQIMKEGMCANYTEVVELSQRVFDTLRPAKKIWVTTPAGTNMTYTFDPNPQWMDQSRTIRERWQNSNGIIREQGTWSNLPNGEDYTSSKDAFGRLVMDGTLGDSLSKYGLLKHPLTVDIRGGRVVKGSVKCEDTALRKEFKKYIVIDENSDRIGEVGFGTNPAVTKLIGVMLQDEKCIGVHTALGHSYAEKTGADWSARTHMDAVLLKPTVTVDGRTIMVDGKYLMDQLAPRRP